MSLSEISKINAVDRETGAQIHSVGIYQKLETGTMSFTTLDLPAPAEDLEVYSFAST